MLCDHCCNYEGAGEHMSFSTFKKLLDRWHKDILKYKKSISIGGGEPTIHPEFWKILGYAMSYGRPWLATNGKETDDALALCKLAKKGRIGATLSLDEWHEPIDDRVIQAFKKNMIIFKENKYGYRLFGDRPGDRREIRTVVIPYPRGKWTKKGIRNTYRCNCKTPRVKPDGTITLCSCEDAPAIGTVEEGIYEKFKYVQLSGIKGYRFCYKDYIINENGYYIPPKKNNK